VGAGQKPDLLLDHPNAERTVLGDLGRHVVGELLKDAVVHQVVQQPRPAGLFGGERGGGEEHLLGEVDPHDVHEVEDAGDVVRDPDLGRGHTERGALAADQDVAGKRQVAGPSPDAPLHHRDDRDRQALDRPQDGDQRVVVGERVAAGLGQLMNVVSRGPDLGALERAQDQHPHLAFLQRPDRLDHLGNGRCAQHVALIGVGEGYGPYVVLQHGIDDRHRCISLLKKMAGKLPGRHPGALDRLARSRAASIVP
jgi:hypothetical protein